MNLSPLKEVAKSTLLGMGLIALAIAPLLLGFWVWELMFPGQEQEVLFVLAFLLVSFLLGNQVRNFGT